MPRYSAPFTKTGSDNVRQIMEILSQSTVQRTKWYAFVIGAAAAADNVFSYCVRRVTGSATGTALTPSPIDTQDAACRAAAKHLITADASSFNTSPVELWRAIMNQRATYQWQCSEGKEFVGPATNTNGLSLGLSATSTANFEGAVSFEE